MSAFTMIHYFRVDEDELKLYTEDYAGKLNLVATCPNKDQLTWLVNCMVSYHKVNVRPIEKEQN